jgi:hypothetical protein
MKYLSLLLIVLLPSTVYSQSTPNYKLFNTLFIANAALAGADIGSTIDALHDPDNYEANPFLRPLASRPWLLGSAKMAGTTSMLIWMKSLYPTHPKLMTWIMIGGIVLQGIVVTSNVRHLK